MVVSIFLNYGQEDLRFSYLSNENKLNENQLSRSGATTPQTKEYKLMTEVKNFWNKPFSRHPERILSSFALCWLNAVLEIV